MRRFVAIVTSVLLVALSAYVVSSNREPAEFHFTPDVFVRFPLGGIVIGAFLCGAVLVLAAVGLQAGRRAIFNWRQTRQRRRREQFDQWQERGAALLWAGDPKQGQALLEKALRRQPDNSAALLALANSYRAAGDSRRALELLAEAAAKQHRTNPDILFSLAETHHELGDRAGELNALERLRALHPRARLVLTRLRDAYVAAGRWSDAVAVQETLVADSRDTTIAGREQERLLALRYQAALQISETAERAKALAGLSERRLPAVPVAVSLGDAQLEGDDAERAWDTWERALRATPRTVLLERLAQIAREPKRQDRLCNLIAKLRAEDANLDQARLFAAQTHLLAGRVSEAERELEAIAATDGAPSLLHRLRAEVLQKRGHTEQALITYAQIGRGGLFEHRCRVCGRASDVWIGYCPTCDSWDSYRSTVEIARA